MNRLGSFFRNTRYGAVFSPILLLLSILVARLAEYFRMSNYHWIFTWGSLLGYLLLLTSFIFSFIYTVALVVEMKNNYKKFDFLLILLSMIPIFFIVYVFW
jgi:hypothetical protein